MEFNGGCGFCAAFALAELTLSAEKVTHIVGFVKGNYAVEVFAQPLDYLIEAAVSALCSAQGVIGGVEYTVLEVNGVLQLHFGKVVYFILAAPGGFRPVTHCIRVKACVHGYPHGFFTALFKVIQNDTADLAAFTNAGTVTDEKSFALSGGQLLFVSLSSIYNGYHLLS